MIAANQDIVPKSSRGPYRLDIRCSVEFLGPLHTGTGERLSVISDAPVLRDAEGKPYLPQASVRGVLRDWCEREAPLLGIDEQYVWRLFGKTPGDKESEDPERHGDRQGRLTVANVRLDPGSITEVRDHVKIDRRWGAAASGGKFDGEILHCKGAHIHLIYEGDGPGDREIDLLRNVVEALKNGLLSFGGKTGWGFGWVAIPAVKKGAAPDADTNPKYSQLMRSNPIDLSRYLRGRIGNSLSLNSADIQAAAANPRSSSSAWSWLRLDLELQFDGPMLVAGPDREYLDEGANIRTPDAMYIRQIDGKAVLPGSSWRGALHSHADRIAATMERPKIADTLFGTVKDVEGSQGLVRVGEGRPIDKDGNPIDKVKTIWMDHVAIDRITGFAADGKLFNCRALASPRFLAPILIRWHAGQKEMQAAVALLLFALRDAEKGMLWVGSRATRGYGLLKELKVQSGFLSVVGKDNVRVPKAILAGSKISTLADAEGIGPVVAELVRAWNKSNQASRNKVGT